MTARQVLLLRAEILRHAALAKIAEEQPMGQDHAEVAEALRAALLAAEGRCTGCRRSASAGRITLFRPHSPVRKRE